jgi:hypothetical protein
VRSVALACALALPLPFLAAGAGSLAERLGRELGRSLSSVADQLAAQRHDPAPLTVIVPLAEAEPVEAPRPRAMKRAPAPAAQKGVYVRANAVLRLARVGARPSGVPVRATADRPAGLALVGVSGLGVGLSDGDILTHAGGVPARSPGQVVGLVISARGARAGQISGRFWRRGEYYDLVVEQPYLKPKPSAPDT